MAKSLIKGKNKLDGAVAIFNWLKANIHYEEPMYYNTKCGALGTLNKKKGFCFFSYLLTKVLGNCCDESHLAVDLMRTAGYPSAYKHGNCYFKISKKVFGQVWSEVEVDGKWYPIDISSSRNGFGVINSWDLRSLQSTSCEISSFVD